MINELLRGKGGRYIRGGSVTRLCQETFKNPPGLQRCWNGRTSSSKRGKLTGGNKILATNVDSANTYNNA